MAISPIMPLSLIIVLLLASPMLIMVIKVILAAILASPMLILAPIITSEGIIPNKAANLASSIEDAANNNTNILRFFLVQYLIGLKVIIELISITPAARLVIEVKLRPRKAIDESLLILAIMVPARLIINKDSIFISLLL